MSSGAPEKGQDPRTGRPKRETKREAVITAARRLFTQESFDRVSVDAVAAAADVSKATIYAYFPNKEALFIAAISAGCDEVFARIDLNAGAAGPLAEVLFRLGCEFLAMIFDPEVDRLHAVIIAEGPHRPALPQMFYEAVVYRSTTMFAEYLKAEADRGALVIDDPYTAAVQFLAIVQGEFRYRVELGMPAARSEEIEPYVRACVATLLRAWQAAEDA